MTTFRKMLITILESIVKARGARDVFDKFEYVDGNIEVFSQIVDYYTDELLYSEPFRAEFRPHEIEAIKQLVQISESAIDGRTNWVNFQSSAGYLLGALTSRAEIQGSQ